MSGHPRPTGDQPKRAHIIAHSGEKASAEAAVAQRCTDDAAAREKLRQAAHCHDGHGRWLNSNRRRRTRPPSWPASCSPLSPGTHQHDEGHAVEDPTDEKRAELVRCEGRGVGSASERRQQDRIVGFEGKWAHLRFQGKTLHSGTMMRIQHELTERSLNLRHGLLGGPIPACCSKSASRSDCQIVAGAAAKVPWTGQIFVSSTGDRRRKM